MGQSQSSSYHPSAIGSHNYSTGQPSDRQLGNEPSPNSPSANWFQKQRILKTGHDKRSASVTCVFQRPHQPLIPVEQRQSSAGPIRHRPVPPEYAPQQARARASTLPTKMDEEQEPDRPQNPRRRSAHRISRDPPLLEESESDHGHPPVPLSPVLVEALKVGLGTGSWSSRSQEPRPRISTDLDSSGDAGIGSGKILYRNEAFTGSLPSSPQPTRRSLAAPARGRLLAFWERTSTETQDSSRSQQERAKAFQPVSPPQDVDGGLWQTKWQDNRQNTSNDSSNPVLFPHKDDSAEPSRFSFSSFEQKTSSGGTDEQEREKRISSVYATPMQLQSRFSYSTTESSGSARRKNSHGYELSEGEQYRTSLDRSRATADESTTYPSVAQGSAIASSQLQPSLHSSMHVISQNSLYSAAAASSHCDPTLLSHDDHESNADVMEIARAKIEDLSPTAELAQATRAPVTSSGRSSLAISSRHRASLDSVMSRSLSSSDNRASSAYERQSEESRADMDRLRSGPLLRVKERGANEILAPLSEEKSLRRPRAFSLMEKLRGRTRRPSEPPAPSTEVVHAFAQSSPTPAVINLTSRTRLRSPSQTQTAPPSAAASSVASISTPLPPIKDELATGSVCSSRLLAPPLENNISSTSNNDNNNKPAKGSLPRSRPQSTYSTRSFRTKCSSSAGLRAKYNATQQQQSKSRTSLAAVGPWWRQNSLKRKGSAGPTTEGKAGKQGRSKQENESWVDVSEEVPPSMLGQDDEASRSTRRKGKEAPISWLWRLSSAKVPLATSAKPTEGNTASSEPIASTNDGPGTATEADESSARAVDPTIPVAVISAIATPSSTPMTGNSSASSFTSLAPPKPPAPVPPLRCPRRPSQRKTDALSIHSPGSSSNVTSLNANYPEDVDFSRHRGMGSEASVPRSESVDAMTDLSVIATLTPREALSTPGTSLVDAISNQASRAPLSGQMTERLVGSSIKFVVRPGGFAPAISPTSPTFQRYSMEQDQASDRFGSDAGTKEVLLSDRESSDRDRASLYPVRFSSPETVGSFGRDLVDEQHPNLQTFLPPTAGMGSAYPYATKARDLPVSLSAMTEESSSTSPEPTRSVTGLPEFGSRSTGHGRNSTSSTVFHSLGSSVSSGSRRRPLPNIPVDSFERREPSGPAESFRTAHSQGHSDSFGTAAQERAQAEAAVSRPRVAGTVTSTRSLAHLSAVEHAGSSSMTFGQFASIPLTASGSEPVITSPQRPSRPLPPAPEAAPTASPSELNRRRANLTSSDGPPLSPSALYVPERRSTTRDSWKSTDGPWSAEVVTQQRSTLAPARGLASAVQPSLNSDLLKKVLAHPRNTIITTPHNDVVEVLSSPPRAGKAKDLRKSGSATSESSSEFGQAPYADTGVQASLAALKALESPGEDPKTIWARQRMFGEQDGSSTLASIMGSRIATAPTSSELSGYAGGSRQRRRVAPYAKSSDELSSSSRSVRKQRQTSKASRGGRGHVWDYSGMADISSASLADASGVASESDIATLLKAHRLRERSKSSPRSPRRSRLQGDPTPRTQVWEELAGVSRRREGLPNSSPPGMLMRSDLPKVEVTPPVEQAPFHKNDWDETVVPAVRRRLEAQQKEADSPLSPTTWISPVLIQKHERLAASIPRNFKVPFPRGDIDPYALGDSERESYRKALEMQLLEISRAERRSRANSEAQISSSRRENESRGKRAERKDSSATTKSKSRRPSKQGYTGDDILAWQAGIGLSGN